MDGWMEGCVDGWMRMDRWMDGWMEDVWMDDGWIMDDGWVDRWWMDGWVDACTHGRTDGWT